jgi:kanamycin kinase
MLKMRKKGAKIMQRTPIHLVPDGIPSALRPFLQDAHVFDSSCSAAARVYFLDKGPGFYLKTAPKGTLKREAAMTEFFHRKGLGAEVLAYESGEKDWLLTRRIPGEDCIDQQYLSDPMRLCDTTAHLLRELHEMDISGCPVPNRTAEYLATARKNYENKAYDMDLFPDNWGYATPEEAWRVVEETGKYLKADTLLHGDYCLPNILLDHWNFSGFIDLDTGGVGDRHVDLFWGMWTLQFNLKTDRYCQRFLDAYGREKVEEDLLRTVAAVEVFG